MKRRRTEPLNWLFMILSLPLLLLLTMPLLQMTFQPSLQMMLETIYDRDVVNAIARSLSLSLAAGMISFILGTPLAYLLARNQVFGKRIIEGIIDLPIMIPHPVIGIAILSLAGSNHPFGRLLSEAGIQIMGTKTGIICVLLFVGLPFYVNTLLPL